MRTERGLGRLESGCGIVAERPGRRLPVILHSAWHEWEQLDPPFAEGPRLLPEVVAALIALPLDQVELRRIPMVPSAWQELKGTVFGVRFRMVGQFDGEGCWSHVWQIHTIGPGESAG